MGVAWGVVGWMLATPTALGRGSADGPVEDLLAQAKEHLAAEDGPGAEALFRRLLEADGDLLPAYEGLAEALVLQKRHGEAVDWLLQLGEGLLGAGMESRALGILKRGLVLAEADVVDGARRGRAHALVGRALSLVDRHGPAVAHLDRAVELGVDDLRTLLYLGAAQWETNAFDAAEATYRSGVERFDAQSPIPRHQLGRFLLWQGHAAEAAAELGRVAERAPGAPDFQLDAARAQQAAGQLEAAAATFRRAVALAPERSHARWGLARVLLRLGRRDAAREQLDTYRDLYNAEQERVRQQEVAKAQVGKGWELLQTGQPDAARSHFESLPVTVESLRGLAATHLATGRPEVAVETLERAVTLDPERGDLRLRLAEARLAAGGS